MTPPFDAEARVRKALADAQADGLTGWHLTMGAARRLETNKLDPGKAVDLERLWMLADAFRAVVWPVTNHAEHAGLSS